MKEILLAATIISPLIVGITGLIKTQIDNNQILPVINLIAGILLGSLLYAEGDYGAEETVTLIKTFPSTALS